MTRTALRWLRRFALVLALTFLIFLVGRVIQTQSGPDLELWHTFIPAEPHAAELDHMDWAGWMAAEASAFDAVRAVVTDRLEEMDRRADNRYFQGSPLFPGRFAQDWNRSYVLEPAGPPVGVVVLMHGMTDSPYSLRHVAQRYRDLGYLAIGLRTPAHGTVPAALTETSWEDWVAAVRLAVREARRRVPAPAPLHLVGYSAGGAMAVKYALEAVEDPQLPRPDRVVLISPMIGISSFARFAGLAGLPAFLPHFAKAAWLSIVPEFNPFKYNSFPVNAARQAHLFTVAIREQVARLARDGRLSGLAPVLTFQSTMDFTVSSRSVVSSFYALLPANGSELVLFDINHNTKLGPLLRAAYAVAAERLTPDPPRTWRLTVLTNTEANATMLERVTPPGHTEETQRILPVSYPRDVFSLSHVALPFPDSDPLYGQHPEPQDEFGVSLGAIAARGEVGVLVVSLDSLARLSWNPFFKYMMGRIEEEIGPAAGR